MRIIASIQYISIMHIDMYFFIEKFKAMCKSMNLYETTKETHSYR